jgi:hypothetical protein
MAINRRDMKNATGPNITTDDIFDIAFQGGRTGFLL